MGGSARRCDATRRPQRWRDAYDGALQVERIADAEAWIDSVAVPFEG